MAHLRSNRRSPILALSILTGLLLLHGCNGNGDDPPTGPETGSVSGEVVAVEGQGVSGAGLTLERTGETPRSTTSGSDGAFGFGDVPTGNWTLALEPPSGWTLPAGQPAEQSVSVQANATSEVTFQVVTEAVEAATVSGSVRHDGWGVANVHLVLRDAAGAEVETTTDADGDFHLQAQEPGDLELEITPPDYFEMAAGEPAVRALTLGSGESESLTVQLSPLNGQETVEVQLLANLTFSPAQVTARPGTRIRWINAESMAHTVTPQGHDAWTSAALSNAGDTFEVVLNNPGEFPYFCQPHQGQGMTGTIVIEP